MTHNKKKSLLSEELIFDLQRFAEGDTEGDAEGSGEGQAPPDTKGTFVERVDPITNKKVKIPKELDVFYGHIISATRKSTEDKFKPIVEAVEKDKAELSEVRLELEKIREASMTAEERAQKNAEKKIREHENLVKQSQEDASNWRQRFTQSSIRNDIYSSFGEVRLCNPEQVQILFAQEGRARIEEIVDQDGKPTGEFETRVTINLVNDKGEVNAVEGTPQQLFPKWIGQERNLHHQVNQLASGAGSQGTQRKGKADYSLLSPIERMKKARET